MGVYLGEQISVFLLSLLVGMALGALYDVFRISRVAFYTSPTAVFIEDVLFFLICGVTTFFFGLTVMDGILRAFLLIGELLGAVLYHFTLGRLVMGVAVKIIGMIKAIFRFLFKWVLRPLWRILYYTIALIVKPFRFLAKILNKLLQNLKFRLKVRRKVLYNQVDTLFLRKKKRQRGRRNEKTQRTGNQQ